MIGKAERQKTQQPAVQHPLPNGVLQRAAVNEAPVHDVPPIVHEVLNSPGQPLDTETRAFFEPRFGHDFSQVRVHTDARAAESARMVNALAYTAGQDVVFGNGQYSPKSKAGLNLLVHELTHVMQQAAQPSGSQNFIQRQAVSAPQSSMTAKNGLSFDERNNDGEFDAVANILIKMRESKVTKSADWKLLAKYAPYFTQISSTISLSESTTVSPSGDRSSVSDVLNTSFLSLEQRLAIIAFPEIFGKYLIDNAISWETITENQRTVFFTLDRTTQESLRKESLKHSSVFNAIVAMHIRADQGAAAMKLEQERIQRMRLREPNPSTGTPEPVRQVLHENSAAYQIMTGDIAIPALVDPVRAAGSDLSVFQNKDLAQYIRRTPPRVLVEATHVYACGIAQLAALSYSRGKMHLIDYSGVMQISDAARWLKEWSLDKKQGEGLLSFSYDYNPNDPDPSKRAWHNPLGYNPVNVLNKISAETRPGAKKVKVSNDSFVARVGTEASASKRFTRLIEERLAKPPKSSPIQEARLALVQGSDRTHTFITYKDMDAVWRSMDVYLDLEDTAWSEFGVPGEYSTIISTLYFVLDPKVTGS